MSRHEDDAWSQPTEAEDRDLGDDEERDAIETQEPVCRTCGEPVRVDGTVDVEASEFICEGCAAYEEPS